MSSKTLRNRYGRATGPQCSKCLKRFYSNRNLREHKDRVHNENRVDRFECDTCHRRFGHKSDMKRHVRTVHLKERRFFCGDCGQAFGRSDARDAHVRMMHDNIRSAACFHCGKTFCKDSDLMRHTRRVHYKEKYAHPRPCSECDFVAEFPSHLRRHFYARHTKIRFRCAFGCMKWYTQVGHLGTHHLKKPWKKGGHSIFRRYKWYAIPKIADSEPLPANETLPVECTWCDMRFQDNSQLKFHILHVHL